MRSSNSEYSTPIHILWAYIEREKKKISDCLGKEKEDLVWEIGEQDPIICNARFKWQRIKILFVIVLYEG